MAFDEVSIIYYHSDICCPIGSYCLTLLDSICDYNPFKHLYKYDKPDFGVFRTMDVPGEEFPHVKAVIYHGLEAEGKKLCRGELLIILRLMLGQLRKVRLLRRKVALVSF